MFRKPKNTWRLLNSAGDTPGYTRKEKGLDALVPDRGWRLLMSASVQHVSGPSDVPGGGEDLVVVCLVRDGEPYVGPFVEHYRALGAGHIVFLDNGSADATVAEAGGHEGVTVLRSSLPYKQYSLLMKQYLIGRFGVGKWVLCADIDEFFDYPYSDVLGIGSLLGYLNSKGYTAVAAQMLDMFPEGPLVAQGDEDGAPLKEKHRFYDFSGIRKQGYGPAWREGNVLANEEIGILRAGVRETLFGSDAVLTKHPLVFPDGGVESMVNSSHRVRGARIADLACVLYHYKFWGRFYEHVVRAVREENYSNLSRRYKQYLKVLEQDPGLRAKSENSRELKSTNDLVEAGFLDVSEEYLDLVRAEERKAGVGMVEAEPGCPAQTFAEFREKERSRAAEVRRLEKRLRQRDLEIEDLNLRVRELQGLLAGGNPTAWKSLEQENTDLKTRVQVLEKQLDSIRESRTWKVVGMLSRVKSLVAGALRR